MRERFSEELPGTFRVRCLKSGSSDGRFTEEAWMPGINAITARCGGRFLIGRSARTQAGRPRAILIPR
jgi:hypothetical protein